MKTEISYTIYEQQQALTCKQRPKIGSGLNILGTYLNILSIFYFRLVKRICCN